MNSTFLYLYAASYILVIFRLYLYKTLFWTSVRKGICDKICRKESVSCQMTEDKGYPDSFFHHLQLLLKPFSVTMTEDRLLLGSGSISFRFSAEYPHFIHFPPHFSLSDSFLLAFRTWSDLSHGNAAICRRPWCFNSALWSQTSLGSVFNTQCLCFLPSHQLN